MEKLKFDSFVFVGKGRFLVPTLSFLFLFITIVSISFVSANFGYGTLDNPKIGQVIEQSSSKNTGGNVTNNYYSINATYNITNNITNTETNNFYTTNNITNNITNYLNTTEIDPSWDANSSSVCRINTGNSGTIIADSFYSNINATIGNILRVQRWSGGNPQLSIKYDDVNGVNFIFANSTGILVVNGNNFNKMSFSADFVTTKNISASNVTATDWLFGKLAYSSIQDVPAFLTSESDPIFDANYTLYQKFWYNYSTIDQAYCTANFYPLSSNPSNYFTAASYQSYNSTYANHLSNTTAHNITFIYNYSLIDQAYVRSNPSSWYNASNFSTTLIYNYSTIDQAYVRSNPSAWYNSSNFSIALIYNYSTIDQTFSNNNLNNATVMRTNANNLVTGQIINATFKNITYLPANVPAGAINRTLCITNKYSVGYCAAALNTTGGCPNCIALN